MILNHAKYTTEARLVLAVSHSRERCKTAIDTVWVVDSVGPNEPYPGVQILQRGGGNFKGKNGRQTTLKYRYFLQ